MVRFTRQLQELFRVAIPREIIEELKWKIGDELTVEIIDKKVIIKR